MSNKIEFKGNVYEIGQQYWCFDSGTSRPPMLDVLISIKEGDFPFKTESGQWASILAVNPSTLGTITKAEVKPKDGEWWLCEFDGDNRVMLFSNGYWTHDELGRGAKYEMVKPLYKMDVVC